MAQFSTAEVAAKFDTDTRTLRKFLRADLPKDAQPGKGSRYTIEGKALRSMRTRFNAWGAAQAAKAEAKADEVEAPEVEVEVDDEVDGPTDEELDALEA